MKSGIYKITNKVNGKLYIGSAMDLKKREWEHFRKLKKGNHHNAHLQHSYNKHREDSFIFSIMLYCSLDDLIFYEQRAIDAYDFKNELYNLSPTAGNCKGMRHSEETKKLISKNRKGKEVTMETRNKLRRASTGKTLSKDTREKLKRSSTGRKLTEGAKKKISKANMGRKHTEESRKKMSISKKSTYQGENHSRYGSKHTEESKKKISDANSGKKHTEESRKKMSISKIGKNGHPIRALKDGKVIGTYLTIREACRVLHISTPTCISRVLKGERKHHKGYTFEYVSPNFRTV